MDRFHECFGTIADPRAENSRHELVESLFIAFLPTLCGAKDCTGMAEFGMGRDADAAR